MERILQKRIPEKLRRNTELDPLVGKLKQEVGNDYDFSVRKSIGEYCAIMRKKEIIRDLHVFCEISPKKGNGLKPSFIGIYFLQGKNCLSQICCLNVGLVC